MRAAVEVLPTVHGWIGQANRESDTTPVLHFRKALQALGLLRKHTGSLVLTRAGHDSHDAWQTLWNHLADRLVPNTDGFDTERRCFYSSTRQQPPTANFHSTHRGSAHPLSAHLRKYGDVLASGPDRSVRGILSSRRRDDDAAAQSVPDRVDRRGACGVGALGAFVYVAVLAGDEGADGADGRRGDAQRPDRGATAVRSRGRLAVAKAVLRSAPGWFGGPASARQTADFFPRRSGLR
jgi:hypothetical protein